MQRHVGTLFVVGVLACGSPAEPPPPPPPPSTTDTDPGADTDAIVEPPPPPLGPVAARIEPSSPRTLDDLQIRWEPSGSVEPELVRVAWEVSDADVDTSDLVARVPADRTRKDQTWTATLTPVYDGDDGPVSSASVTIANTPPTVALTLTPASPNRTDTLSALVEVVDPDEDDDYSLSFEWRVGNTVVASGPSDTLSSGFSRGQVVRVTANADDGDAVGAAQGSVTIVNAPPVATVTLSPEVIRTQTPVTANAVVSDPDGDAVGLAWSWRVNGAQVSGANSFTLGSSNFSRGQRVQAVLQVDDGRGGVTTATSPEVQVANTAPTAAVARVLPSTARALTHNLRCSVDQAATDPDGDTITYSATWQVTDASGTQSFTGTTTSFAGDTVPRTETEVGDVWSCVLNASDGTATVPSAPATRTIIAPGAIDISAGAGFSCAVRGDGFGLCWGGATNPSLINIGYEGEEGFVAISGNFGHSCGRLTDGTLHCWGANDWGQASPPAGTFTRVVTGDRHTCALKPDSRVLCWGNDENNQLVPPTPSTAFRDIAVGNDFTCGLRATNNTILCWGAPVGTPPATGFTQIGAGLSYVCGLRTDGTLQCFGTGTSGQTSPPSGSDYTAISVGVLHACARRTSGAVVCWGLNTSGQRVVPLQTFSSVAAGATQTCGITTSGEVMCWGGNLQGERDKPAW